MSATDRTAYLFLSLLQAKAGASIITRLGDMSPQEVLEAPPEYAAGRLGLTQKGRKTFEELRREFDPDAVLIRLKEKGLKAITFGDADYPDKLSKISDPPPALFVNGEIPQGPAVAVVGSRKASATGVGIAADLGRSLGERGVCVVSGLALGTDAAAHRGALDASGPVVGVLGCGIDVIYPKSNQTLFGRVAGAGAVLSEYYLGEAPLRWRFPARNRIIAGLCDAVVVVEAAEKSGALITARHAYEAGRDVWAVPGPVGYGGCRGSNALLADGAGVLWDVDGFVDAVAPESTSQKPVAPETSGAVPAGLPGDEAAVLACVGFEPTGVDAVAGRSGIGMRELLPALAMLELKGYITRDVAGAYVRCPIPEGRLGEAR